MHSLTKFALSQSEQMLRKNLEIVSTIDPSSTTTKDYLDALMLLAYERSTKK